MKSKLTYLSSTIIAFMCTAPSAFGASTAVITFDPDGTGGDASIEIGSFDWTVASAMADGAIGSTTPVDEFQLYTMGNLSPAYKDTNGQDAYIEGIVLGDYQISFIAGFGEKVTSSTTTYTCVGTCDGGGDDVYTITQTATFDDATSGTFENFFEIWWDSDIDIDPLAGTGYGYNADGTSKLILSGSINDILSTANFTSNLGTFIDVDNTGDLSSEDTLVNTSTDPNSPYQLLDSYNADDWTNSYTANTIFLSVAGDGSTSIEVDVTSIDTAFFLDDITTLTQDLNFKTEQDLPYQQGQPAMSYETEDGTFTSPTYSGASTLSQLIESMVLAMIDTTFFDFFNENTQIVVNGIFDNDIVFQTDASNSFRLARQVPEPGMLALLGAALGLIGFTVTRRRANTGA